MSGEAPEVVFVRTRRHYESYTDFWSLVNLSGFKSCEIEEIDFSKNALYVVTPMNGDVEARLATAPPGQRICRVAWWGLERHDAPPGRSSGNFADFVRMDVDRLLKLVDHIWVSDMFVHTLDPRTTFVLLGSHPGLASGPPSETALYDVCHMSYIHGRRIGAMACIPKSIRVGPNGWGQIRDNVLRSSRAILNIHQTPALVGEPLRFALAAAYKLPVLTETLADPRPLEEGKHFVSAPLEHIPDMVKRCVSDPALPRIGESLFKALASDTDFGRCVREGAARVCQKDL